MRLPLLVSLVACGCAAPEDAGRAGGGGKADSAGAGAAAAQVLADPGFSLQPLDTGDLRGRCTVRAPWGSDSWGVEGATFSDPDDRRLDAARFTAEGGAGYLYGKESRGAWGFVRYVQGTMWGGTNCGSIPWNTFEPVRLGDRPARLEAALYRDTDELLAPTGSWIMIAFNVWLSSPDFEVPGGDVYGKKPLVMDLAVHQACNWSACGLESFESDAARHYQARVGEAPPGAWEEFSVDLQRHVRRAFERFDLPARARETLAVHQVELVIELHRAEGAASLDDFAFRVGGDPSATR